jgi:ribosome-binding factor A
MENRQRRLGELLKQEISDMVLREIKDPRIGFVSITSVILTADLRHAKVLVSVFGSERERTASLAGLRSATGFIKRELGHRLRLKYVPDITIVYDDSIEQGTRIVSLIDSVVKKEDGISDEE